MTGLPAPTLEALGHERPEWSGWLALLATSRRAADDPTWDAALASAEIPPPTADRPLLDGAVLTVDDKAAGRFVRELLGLAADNPGPAATLRGAAALDLNGALTVLQAAVIGERARLDAVAVEIGADARPLRALAPLLAAPLLRACAQRWADRVPAPWLAGHCLVCASWPLLAEERGLERARRFRCGRCASDWHGQWLRCPFCGNTDHLRLGTLLPEARATSSFVVTCEACRGYLKTLTTLKPTPAGDLGLVDLTTVELDVAAIDRGYARHADAGHALTVTLSARPRPGRRWLAGLR